MTYGEQINMTLRTFSARGLTVRGLALVNNLDAETWERLRAWGEKRGWESSEQGGISLTHETGKKIWKDLKDVPVDVDGLLIFTNEKDRDAYFKQVQSEEVNSDIAAALVEAEELGVRVVGIAPPEAMVKELLPWAAARGMVPDDRTGATRFTTPGVEGVWSLFTEVSVQFAPLAPEAAPVSAPDDATDAELLAAFSSERMRDAFAEAQVDGYDVRGVVMPDGEAHEGDLMGRLQWIGQKRFSSDSQARDAWVLPGWMDGRESRRSWRTYMGVDVLCSRQTQHGMEAESPTTGGGEFKLRPYQTKALEELADLWQAGFTRVLILSVTGSGKTEMFISETLGWVDQDGYAIVMAPKQELVRQAANRLRKALVLMGRDPDMVGMMMQGHEPLPGQRIIVSTFDSAHKLDSRGKLMVIVDEAHRTGGDRVMAALSALAPERTLGVTATPKRNSGAMLGDVFQRMVTALEYQEGFDGGYLIRPRYYTPAGADIQALYDLRAKIRTMRDAAKGKVDIDAATAEAWMTEPKVIGDIIGHVDRYASDRSGIAFCSTVRAAQALAEALVAGGYTAEMICAKTNRGDREGMLERFGSGETQWLCNVDVLTEGVDVPACSAIIIARPTKSAVRWIQMAGRALRPAPDKTDCVILDHTGAVLEMGPVEFYTKSDWPLEKGQNGSTKGGKDSKPPMSTKEIDRECGCGNTWHGGPVCPVCHSINTTRRFESDNIAALDAELQEARGVGDIAALAATFKGQTFSAQDIIGIMGNKKISASERQLLLKKLTTPAQAEMIYRQLITWAESKRKPGGAKPEHRAGRLYHDTFGTWPAPQAERSPMPYTACTRPVVMEIARLNAAAYYARKNGGFVEPVEVVEPVAAEVVEVDEVEVDVDAPEFDEMIEDFAAD